MKNLIVILCLVSIIFNMPVYASSTSEQKIEKLKQYNIINCYDDGNFYPQKNITRAEFCKMVSIMLGITDDADNTKIFFADVPAKHWANKYITFCYKRELVKGVFQAEKIYFVDLDENGNEIGKSEIFYDENFYGLYVEDPLKPENLFAPDNYITYQDALKIVVCALGYEEMAKGNGDYPTGYVSTAKNLKIIDTAFSNTDYISRESAAEIIYNSLFTPLLIKKEISDENGDRIEYTIADGKNSTELQTLYIKYFEKYE